MNKITLPLLAAALLLPAMPASAYVDKHGRHHRDRQYSSSQSNYDQCRRDKRRAGHRGTVIGAVGGGAGTALLGGGVGGSLLGAGVGALAGNVIGRGGHKGC